ncbi:MAG: PAAR-like domain-containing protein [Pseudomonadota bacterium]
MANEVFANELEISCKAAAGKSVASFPDPCFSPPPPSGGPIVIPYANTAFAKDLAKGSTTVFISGKPIAKRDQSYFKTSTGNEPAIMKKGVATGVKKGKAYYQTWSMDVKVEDLNVCRHTDKMTHNHASLPGNTGPWAYVDTSARRSDCRMEIQRVNRACGGEREVKRGNRTTWETVRGQVRWKRTNCLGLNIKPRSLDQSKLDDFLGDIQGQLDDLNIYEQAINTAQEVALQQAEELLTRIVGKAVAKRIIGAAAGPIGWIVTIVDGANDVAEVIELKGHIDAVNAEADRLMRSLTSLDDRLAAIPDQLAAGDTGSAAATMADVQRTIATANDCVRARKCMLVSMKSTDNNSGGTNAQGGCCGGQTGHHMIPHAWVDGVCDGYRYRDAPVVCAEGTNQYHGSHGAMHTHTDRHAAEEVGRDGDIAYDDARDAAIRAHRDTFPLSFCSADCLREQLDNYYDKACDEHSGIFSDPNPDLNFQRIGGPSAPAGDELS